MTGTTRATAIHQQGCWRLILRSVSSRRNPSRACQWSRLYFLPKFKSFRAALRRKRPAPSAAVSPDVGPSQGPRTTVSTFSFNSPSRPVKRARVESPPAQPVTPPKAPPPKVPPIDFGGHSSFEGATFTVDFTSGIFIIDRAGTFKCSSIGTFTSGSKD